MLVLWFLSWFKQHIVSALCHCERAPVIPSHRKMIRRKTVRGESERKRVSREQQDESGVMQYEAHISLKYAHLSILGVPFRRSCWCYDDCPLWTEGGKWNNEIISMYCTIRFVLWWSETDSSRRTCHHNVSSSMLIRYLHLNSSSKQFLYRSSSIIAFWIVSIGLRRGFCFVFFSLVCETKIPCEFMRYWWREGIERFQMRFHL